MYCAVCALLEIFPTGDLEKKNEMDVCLSVSLVVCKEIIEQQTLEQVLDTQK